MIKYDLNDPDDYYKATLLAKENYGPLCLGVSYSRSEIDPFLGPLV